jgi:hypothetical protein
MMRNERNWSGESYTRARAQTEDIEVLMRSILKLFADGCLVYRRREERTPSVQTKSDRLKRLRTSQHMARPFQTNVDGPAVA